MGFGLRVAGRFKEITEQQGMARDPKGPSITVNPKSRMLTPSRNHCGTQLHLTLVLATLGMEPLVFNLGFLCLGVQVPPL